jgi:pimeloyl-ACP methyl ester carboxylesterase
VSSTRPILDAAARARVGGRCAQLEGGQTAFSLVGNVRGPKVVLVHGTTSPSFAWAPTVEHLVEAGFQVLTYDLYGRGMSDRPRCRYDLELFVRQLHQLLEQVGWTKAIRIVGWSLGAVIGAAWAGGHPGMSNKRIALIAPAGFGNKLPLIGRLVRVPGLGEALFAMGGRKKLADGWRNIFVEPDRWDDYGWRFQEQFAYEGVERAVLSTLRNVDLGDQSPVWRKLGEAGREALVVWGGADAVCPIAGLDRAASLLPDAQLVRIDGAGHAVHRERPLEVGEAIVDFFRAGDRAPVDRPTAQG